MSTSGKVKDMTNIKLQLREEKLEGRYYTLEQKEDRLECLLCCFCEGANEYAVGESDPNFNVNNKKGYIREESDCLGRVCCVCNRPFTADLKLFNEEIAVAERPCKYAFGLYAGCAWSGCRALRMSWLFLPKVVDSWVF